MVRSNFDIHESGPKNAYIEQFLLRNLLVSFVLLLLFFFVRPREVSKSHLENDVMVW